MKDGKVKWFRGNEIQYRRNASFKLLLKLSRHSFAVIMLVAAAEVCKYTQQSENHALKLSRLDLARLQRSRRCRRATGSLLETLLSRIWLLSTDRTARRKNIPPHLAPPPLSARRTRFSGRFLPLNCTQFGSLTENCTHTHTHTSM